MGSGKGAYVLRGSDVSQTGKQTIIVPDLPAPTGLANVGNTCYANAALQCLLNTALTEVFLEPHAAIVFRRFSSNVNILSNGSGSVDSEEDDEEAIRARRVRREERRKARQDRKAMQATCTWLTHELTEITKEYTKVVASAPRTSGYLSFLGVKSAKTQRVVDPGSITRNPHRISSCLHPYRQEDAHEFLRGLLSSLVMNGHNKQLSSLFDGLLESAVTCQECSHVSLTRDRYMDLSLDVTHDCIKTLPDALEVFTRTETLDDDNKVLCSRCGVKQQVTKGLRLATAPSILVCHLKRFAIDAFGRTRRLNKHIRFPLRLEIGDYMSKVNKATPPPYELVGVLVHQGRSCDSGHYLSYVRSGNEWYKTNDSVVTKVDVDTVLSQQAYILFYEVAGMRDKRKASMMLTSTPSQERSTTPDTLESWGTISSEEGHQGSARESSFMSYVSSCTQAMHCALVNGELCCGPLDGGKVHIHHPDLSMSESLLSTSGATGSGRRRRNKKSMSSSNLKDLEKEASKAYSTAIPSKLPAQGRSRHRFHSFSNSDPGGKMTSRSLRRGRSRPRLQNRTSPGRRKDKDGDRPPRHRHRRRHSHGPPSRD